MVVGRWDMLKDTMSSDWRKNKYIGGLVSGIQDASALPDQVAPSIYGDKGGAPPRAISGVQPSGAALQAPAASTLSVAPMSSHTPNAALPAPAAQPPQPFAATFGNGMRYTADAQGNRTYTMGSPGQDGYGSMTVHNGSALPMPAGGQAPIGANPGLSINGPADAVARFNQPVGAAPMVAPDALNGGSRATMLALDQQKAAAASTPQQPVYQGPESGLGWKTRLGLYKEQMDTFNHQMGNTNTLNVEAMREAGAGGRAALAAQGVNDRNTIDAQQVANQASQFNQGAALRNVDLQSKQLALGDIQQMNKLKTTLQTADPASAEYQRAYAQWTALNGKNDNLYGVIDRYDENGQKIGADLFNRATGDVKAQKGAALQEGVPVPSDPNKLIPGTIYTTSDGRKGRWDGKAFNVM